MVEAWRATLRHWRRVGLSAGLLFPPGIWMEYGRGAFAQVYGALFGVVFIAGLSLGFEWMVGRRARIWGTLVILETIAVLSMVTSGLVQWLWQALALVPANPGALPNNTSGLIATLVGSQVLLVYWVLTYVFPYAADDARLRSMEADRLRRAAELAHLRASLEPHFLLNTLNAIAGFASESPREARRLIAALGELLRDSLDDRDTETVSDQLTWLRHYVGILQARHGDRLRVSWNIADDARPVVVPRLLLQPLVENAIVHGALSRRIGGEVHVRAAVTRAAGGPTLICEVRDNGTGLASGNVRDGAKGLALVQHRLEVFAGRGRFWIEPARPGTRAIVEIPL